MDWTFSSTKKLEPLLKSLEKKQKALIASYNEQVEIIADNPKAGSSLQGDLGGYYSWDWTFHDISVRICYRFSEGDKHIYFVYFGTRENFYKELKRYLK
ncbi:ParE-like toxin of type II toxin-antitoxin system [Desulfotomaculum arcticum]|uniref:ParE-like toxin of type II toxin-antitoxin system n=1 Tax=Desulfotruncus arcticus DSM 17038 TaxID=1121424 RepID=A0A1I2YPP0_9FIRM|nr:type II toxin-antitoxin system RelE/ParE family toxin [Desulfotruncus arcticus]SFH27633.1 ParE-like toxin of type II toxin-antitoxin system [Desulfotomaculum arcticum] [Desulfotruncus arcticus DSM 17038]